MRKNKKDIITQKQLELAKLMSRSSTALDLVTSTINNLSTINEEIDVRVSEIEEAKTKLQNTEDGLKNTRDHNAKVIEKFKALIEV